MVSKVLTTPSFSRCGSGVEGVEKEAHFHSTTPLRYIYRGVVEVWDVAILRCGGFEVWKRCLVGEQCHG